MTTPYPMAQFMRLALHGGVSRAHVEGQTGRGPHQHTTRLTTQGYQQHGNTFRHVFLSPTSLMQRVGPFTYYRPEMPDVTTPVPCAGHRGGNDEYDDGSEDDSSSSTTNSNETSIGRSSSVDGLSSDDESPGAHTTNSAPSMLVMAPSGADRVPSKRTSSNTSSVSSHCMSMVSHDNTRVDDTTTNITDKGDMIRLGLGYLEHAGFERESHELLALLQRPISHGDIQHDTPP